MFLTTQFRKKF